MAVMDLAKDGRGVSLVEVLVSVAILAIISVPLLSGFRLSSTLDNKAHHAQSVTERAQAELETIKSITVDEYKAEVIASLDLSGAHGTVLYGSVPPDFRTAFPDIARYPDDLFREVTCTRKDVELAGKRYTVKTVFNPAPYSQYDMVGKGVAADSNVFGISRIGAIDGLRYPLIADEINRFEGKNESGLGAVLKNLLSQRPGVTNSELNSSTVLLDLCEDTVKTVKVTITGNESAGWVKVICDLTYELPLEGIRLDYNVFSAEYDLKSKLDAAGNFLEWNAGGNIYLFAKAWQEHEGMPVSYYNPLKNNLEIVNQYVGTNPLNIYLVRGHNQNNAFTPPQKWGLNFDKVSLEGRSGSTSIYSDFTLGQNPLGYRPADSDFQGNFYTNIKGSGLAKQLRAEDMERTVGQERAGLRCLLVTVTFQDQTDASIKASLTSMKEMN